MRWLADGFLTGPCLVATPNDEFGDSPSRCLRRPGFSSSSPYSALLFVRALRKPESIGSWIPRLIGGWHQGWREVRDQQPRPGQVLSVL